MLRIGATSAALPRPCLIDRALAGLAVKKDAITVVELDQAFANADPSDEFLFDRQQSELRYVDPNYLLDPAVLFELSNFLSELAGKWQMAPQTAPPEEIAALYAFLASDEGGYFTGAVISIDGGETA